MEPRAGPEDRAQGEGERHRIDGPATTPDHPGRDAQEMATFHGKGSPPPLQQSGGQEAPGSPQRRHRKSRRKAETTPPPTPPDAPPEVAGDLRYNSHWEWDGHAHVRLAMVGVPDRGQRSRFLHDLYRRVKDRGRQEKVNDSSDDGDPPPAAPPAVRVPVRPRPVEDQGGATVALPERLAA